MKYYYDSFGRALAISYPDGSQVDYGYDRGGALNHVSAGGVDYVSALTYNRFGERERIRYGNGVETQYVRYSASHRLMNVISDTQAGAPVQRLEYTYNAVGNVTALQSSMSVTPGVVGGPVEQTFDYDDLDQLIGASGHFTDSVGDRTYALGLKYNRIGNITSNAQEAFRITGGVSTPDGDLNRALEYDYSGRVHAVSAITASAGPTRSYSYDLDGNQTGWSEGSASRAMTWNEEDRLTEVNDGEGTSISSYIYDANGNRTHHIHNSDVTVYANQFYSIRNGNIESRHIFAGDTRVASLLSGYKIDDQTYYYHTNHLQSTQYVTDAQGQIVEHEEALPFGETWISERASDERVPYLFTGKELDEDTGLYYFGARYFDPRVAQWASADPILAEYMGGSPNGGVWNPGNLGLYGYCRNSPVRLRDPDGRFDTTADPATVDEFFQWLGATAGEAAGGVAGLGVAVAVGGGTVAVHGAIFGSIGHDLMTGMPEETPSGVSTDASSDDLTQDEVAAQHERGPNGEAVPQRVAPPTGGGGGSGGGGGGGGRVIGGAVAAAGAGAAAGSGRAEAPEPSPSGPSSREIVPYDPVHAAGQILGGPPVTPGGRNIGPHAAERMVSPPAGRAPMSPAEVDHVLDTGTQVRYSAPRDTVQVTRRDLPGRPSVVVDGQTGRFVVTVIRNNR